MTKAEWFDHLCHMRLTQGYTEAENVAYRADLEARYAGITDAAFKKAQAERAKRWGR
jgi:hypothetical protein